MMPLKDYIKSFGIKNTLEALIYIVKESPSQEKYIKTLIKDLEKTLKNYNNRY